MKKEELEKRILSPYWTVEIDPNAIYERAYGSAGGIGCAYVEILYTDGKEIETPKCEKCNEYKQCIIGKYAYAWICPTCQSKQECKECGHVWTWMPNNNSACMRCGEMKKN